MNTDLEARLTESMQHKVEGLTLTSEVLARARRRHRRRAAAMRVGYTLGVAGLATALAAGLMAGAGTRPRQHAGTVPSAQARPASLRLADAAAASDNISYRI